MAKLVAFYSRADENYFGGSMKYIQIGNTEKAAKMIADMTGADLFKIEQKIPYAADYNTCIAQAKEDKQTGKRPEILNLPQDIDQYDEIYLGYLIILFIPVSYAVLPCSLSQTISIRSILSYH